MSNHSRTYYEILGVSNNATDVEIRSAFREKAKQTHPDRPENKGQEHLFREITEARDVLLDHQKRREYDQRLFRQLNEHGARTYPRGYSREQPATTSRSTPPSAYGFDTDNLRDISARASQEVRESMARASQEVRESMARADKQARESRERQRKG